MLNLSLTARLTLAFTLLMVLACSGISWTLYHALDKELTWRDEQTLLNRARQMQQLMQDGARPETLPLYFNRMVDTRQDILLVRSASGDDVSINHTGVQLPQDGQSPPAQEISATSLRRFTAASGVDVAAISAIGKIGATPVTITVARVATERARMLEQYRRNSLLVCLLTIFTGALLSPFLIRRGLRAITHLSQITAETDSGRLSEPVPVTTLPAELLPLGNALNTMRQRLASDFSRLTQFADDLAHELRTPVTILLGQNQVALSRTRSTEEYQQLLAANIDELEGLARLTDNILFLARAEHHNVRLNRARLLLTEELENITDFLAPLAEEKAIQIIIRSAGETVADKLLLQRALTNLISNAIRYAPGQSTIVISSYAEQGRDRIEVANQGSELFATGRLFQRFWRDDSARHTPGTGLGLALVKAIAELHGGEAFYRYEAGYNIFGLTVAREINIDGVEG